MKTHSQARNTLARLTRKFHNGDIDASHYRALVYGFSAMLGYFKLEADLEVERRLEIIEDALREKGHRV